MSGGADACVCETFLQDLGSQSTGCQSYTVRMSGGADACVCEKFLQDMGSQSMGCQSYSEH